MFVPFLGLSAHLADHKSAVFEDRRSECNFDYEGTPVGYAARPRCRPFQYAGSGTFALFPFGIFDRIARAPVSLLARVTEPPII